MHRSSAFPVPPVLATVSQARPGVGSAPPGRRFGLGGGPALASAAGRAVGEALRAGREG